MVIQLGGYVVGNLWLVMGVVCVIVNQVNLVNFSYLCGYLEVVGVWVQVVVVNLVGIICFGCGFINVNCVMFIMGVFQIVNGNLDSYCVVSGVVCIEGNGMDVSCIDYVEIIVCVVQVNVGIWVFEFKVSVGFNIVSVDYVSVVFGVVVIDVVLVVVIDVV